MKFIRLLIAILAGMLSIGAAYAQESHDIRISWVLGARGNYGLANHISQNTKT